MVTDADRLAAAGQSLEIAGHSLRLRYTARSLKLMEDRYGSLSEIAEAFTRIARRTGAIYEPLCFLLACGLRGQTVDEVPESGGDAVPRLVDEDWILDRMDPSQILRYIEVAMSALEEALPRPPSPASTEETKAESRPAPNGSSSSGLPSSDSAEAPASSGTR